MPRNERPQARTRDQPVRPVRTIAHAALTLRAGALDPSTLAAWFERRGWAAATTAGAPALRVAAYTRDVEGGVEACVLLDDDPGAVTAVLASLARDLARVARAPVMAHEVIGRDREVPNPFDPTAPPGFDLTARSLEASPEGELEPVGSGVSDEALVQTHGDLDETVGYVLRDVLDRAGGGPRPGDRCWTASLQRAAGALSPRLADLARTITEAGAWSLEPQGDRWLIQIVSPTRGKRISAVSDDELRALRAAVDVEPAGRGRP